MNPTSDQYTALLLGLFGATGPVAKLLTALFPTATGTVVVSSLLDIASVLTPIVAGMIFAKLQSPTNAVVSVNKLGLKAVPKPTNLAAVTMLAAMPLHVKEANQ